MVQFERHPHLGALQQQLQSTPHAAEVPCSPILYALIFWLCRIAGSFRSARMADSFGFSDGQQNTVTSRPQTNALPRCRLSTSFLWSVTFRTQGLRMRFSVTTTFQHHRFDLFMPC